MVPRLRRSGSSLGLIPSPTGLGSRLAVGPPGLDARVDPSFSSSHAGSKAPEGRFSRNLRVLTHTLKPVPFIHDFFPQPVKPSPSIKDQSAVSSTAVDRLLRKISASQFITPSAPSVPRDAHAAPCHE
jgi:hypothetical protein